MLSHSSHTSCKIVRLTVMVYPAAATASDLQCGFLCLCLDKISSASDSHYNVSSQISGQERERDMVRTINLERESQPVRAGRFITNIV